MTFPRTKIRPPQPRAAYVERGTLQARLAEALSARRVVLVVAPAGYGKTMLLAQAIARMPADRAVAWISVDAGDDLQGLVECLLAALEPFDPPWRTAPEALLAQLGQREADDRRSVTAEIINTLDACEVPHGVIVLDDLHRVDDPAFFRFLDQMIERMTPRWTLVLASRVEPPLALARLRASDEMAEFTQLQLQFARDDARRMAAAAGLDQALADRVFDRTQGWPAGLRIAIGAMRQDAATPSPAAPSAIERALRAGNRPLFEFLLTEVLGELPRELADFLMRVSVLPELEAKRCAVVSGNANAAALLDAIERLGLFVDVLDGPVRTLRLHDLLREAMQQRLSIEQPDLLAEVRARAAATELDPSRRIGLLLDTGRLDEASAEAYAHLPVVVATAGTASPQNLIERFPADFRERSPDLAFVRGLIHWVHWEFPAMLASFEHAEQGFAAAGDVTRAMHARAYRAHALITRGKLDEAAAVVESMTKAALPRETRIIALNAQWWLAIDAGRLRAVSPLVDEMVGLLEQVDRLDLWYHTTPPMRVPGLPGITRPLMRHANALLRVAGESSMSLRALAILAQGWCAAFKGRIEQARTLRERAREDAAWTGNTGAVRGHLLALTALLDALEGNAPAAIEAARARARELQSGFASWGRFTLLMFTARIAAVCDDASALRETLAEAEPLRVQFDPPGGLPRTRPRLPILAQLAWLEGRLDDAIAGWRDALAYEEEIDLLGQAAETRVRLARALARRKDLAAAAEVLVPALERDEDDMPGGALLARHALDELADVEWGDALTSAQRATLLTWSLLIAKARPRHVAGTSPDAAADSGSRAGAGGEGLTARELDVLRHIASGDSNKVIARSLDLSPHTVKRHVANILGKLQVETRGQAASRYRARAS